MITFYKCHERNENEFNFCINCGKHLDIEIYQKEKHYNFQRPKISQYHSC